MSEDKMISMVGILLKDMGFPLEPWQFDEIGDHVPYWAISMAENVLESGWIKP